MLITEIKFPNILSPKPDHDYIKLLNPKVSVSVFNKEIIFDIGGRAVLDTVENRIDMHQFKIELICINLRSTI